MAEKSNSTVYIGNLDDRVSARVLYDILIQAGRVLDLHIPCDKENGKRKGFAFAEYESEEIAEYAVKLFSGLVTLYKRKLKFNISGQDKPSTSLPMAASSPTINSSFQPRSHPVLHNEVSPQTRRWPTPVRFSDHRSNYSQVPSDTSRPYYNGYRVHNQVKRKISCRPGSRDEVTRGNIWMGNWR